MAGRKGAIAFGLVYIPVELFAATQDDAVRFNQLAKDSMKRVRYVKTCPDCKRELGPDDIVKGYQYEKGKYVVVTDEELESIKSDADRSMKIVQFANADEISPIFFEKPYQIVAQPGGERALELLRQAMLAEGKVAIGTTVLGNSETPVAIMPYGDDLVMITLHYASEVKDIPKNVQHLDVAEPEPRHGEAAHRQHDRTLRPRPLQERLSGKAYGPHPEQDSRQGRRDRACGRTAEQHHRPHGCADRKPETAGRRKRRRRQGPRSEMHRHPQQRQVRHLGRAGPSGQRDGRARGRRRKARSQAQPQARLVTPAPGERTAGNAAASGPARARRPVR